MKFAMVRQNQTALPALLNSAGDRFWLIASLAPKLPADMAGVIASLAAGAMLPEPSDEGQRLEESMLDAPLPNPPRNIFCVGKNYRAHAAEFANSGYDSSTTSAVDAVPVAPIIFTKPSSSISGPWDDIPLVPGLDAQVDYEAELAVIIGRGGRAIPKDEAMAHVFGYTVVNDVTARDLQGKHKQWLLGKGIDRFCPMGPWIVTADELPPDRMHITCVVNGEKRQDASTADLIFDIPTLIETISLSMALLPGDVIATGTPEGVGIGFRPPRFLREGDVVECAVDGLGRIRNCLRRQDLAALRGAA